MEPLVPTLARAATLAPAYLDTQVRVARFKSANVLEVHVATEAAALTMTMDISAPAHLVFMATTVS